MTRWVSLFVIAFIASSVVAQQPDPPHPLMNWVKRHPSQAAGKRSPRMGYETTYGYDSLRKILIRYSGHNQGGGGEQNSEVWTYDLAKDVWQLKEPNDAPPGICCGQQNVCDEHLRKFIRFPSFSGSHGWQDWREIYLKDCSVWTYDLDSNTFRAMRPCPEVHPSPLRGAAWDPELQITVVHGGEGSGHGTVLYDLYTNTWHEPKPKAAPQASLSQPGFGYNPVHRLFVLFGSQFHDDPRTWVYDLRKNAWRVLEVNDHPPADKSCPILAADSRNGVVLCSVTNGEKLETWVLEVDKAKWTKLRLDHEPDFSGGRNRVLVYLADQNLFVLENRTKDEQQIWTFRYAEAPQPLARIEGLRVTTAIDAVQLTWDPVNAADARYTVYRAQAATPWQADFQPVARDLKEAKFRDAGLEYGKLHFYRISATDGANRLITSSWLARTQPAVIVDVLASVPDARHVELKWAKPAGEDIVGYHIERADVSVYSAGQTARFSKRFAQASDVAVGRVKSIGAFRRLTTTPLAEPRFIDDTIDLSTGQKEPTGTLLVNRPLRAEDFNAQALAYRYATYAYRVIAVNRLGVESGPSPLVFTWPSAVQHVFSKEEGQAATRVKWQANRETSVTAYHVYRLDGRWDSDKISRLTSRPVRQTEFLDETAGRSTRRYEIVATDSLGQEGEPSQPIWSRREWQKYYIPYTGEWHQ